MAATVMAGVLPVAATLRIPATVSLATFLITWIVVTAVLGVISLIAWAKIISKAGYSGWWVLIVFVPVVGALIALVMFFVFAFSEWPIERQLATARSRRDGGYGPLPGQVPQWTPPAPPGGYPVAGYAPSGYLPQPGYPPTGYPPQPSYAPTSYAPTSYAPTGYPPPGGATPADSPGADIPGIGSPGSDTPDADAPQRSRYLPRTVTPPADAGPPPPPAPPPPGGMA